ncbi:alkaline phosphatase family protein [Nakamurella endophytica]
MPVHPSVSSSAPRIPRYGTSTLSAVLPGAAAALGVRLPLPAVELPAAERVCVVLVDGLGYRQLSEHRRSAPFLATLLDGGGSDPSDPSGPSGHSGERGDRDGGGDVLQAGCPSTTATSLGSLGTGRPPGSHGLVGYEVLDPGSGRLLNELRWSPDVDPVRWQPGATVFEQVAAAGVAVHSIGAPEFDGSGLTEAALRGARFHGVRRWPGRVDAAIELLAEPGLVYAYWGDVDGAGHVYGPGSSAWRRELRHLDRGLDRLARSVPHGTVLVVTADHGMVDVPHESRLDLAERPDLTREVRLVGGDPRLAQLYVEPGAGDRVAGRFADEAGDRAWVRTRDEAVAEGWFGPVDAAVLPRIGDVLVAARSQWAVVDSRTTPKTLLSLEGQHGSLTPEEQDIPLLTTVVH